MGWQYVDCNESNNRQFKNDVNQQDYLENGSKYVRKTMGKLLLCACVWRHVFGDSVCITPNAHHNVIIKPQHVSTAFFGVNLTALVFSYKPIHYLLYNLSIMVWRT